MSQLRGTEDLKKLKLSATPFAFWNYFEFDRGMILLYKRLKDQKEKLKCSEELQKIYFRVSFNSQSQQLKILSQSHNFSHYKNIT